MVNRSRFLFGLCFIFLTPLLVSPEEKSSPQVVGSYLFESVVDPDDSSRYLMTVKNMHGKLILTIPGNEIIDFRNLAQDSFFWKEAFPSRVINRTDLNTLQQTPISEGAGFLVSPNGKFIVIDRFIELILKDLSDGSEIVFYPNRAGLAPSKDWPRAGDESWHELVGWSIDGRKFWFHQAGTEGSESPLAVLIDQRRLIETNVQISEEQEKAFNLDYGWIAESGYPFMKSISGDEIPEESLREFEDKAKQSDYMLTVTALISGKTVSLATSRGQRFYPEFKKDHFVYTVNGEQVRLSYPELQEKLNQSGQKKLTVVGQAEIKK